MNARRIAAAISRSMSARMAFSVAGSTTTGTSSGAGAMTAARGSRSRPGARSSRRVVSASLSLAACLALIAGCTSRAPTGGNVETPTFDLAHVKATWAEDCLVIADAAFCSDVNFAFMTGGGATLYVTTNLARDDRTKAQAICDRFAVQHYDANAVDFGYRNVVVNAATGPLLASCTVR